MQRIFIGFLFIFLDFNLQVGESTIGLIPDFVGYVFVTQGLAELKEEGECFASVRPFAVAMAVYTSALYILDLFGSVYVFLPVTYVFALVSTLVAVFISYQIVAGIVDIEHNRQISLEAASLRRRWVIMAIMQFISLITPMLYARGSGLVMVTCLVLVIGLCVADILFLIAFHSTKNRYNNWIHPRGGASM